VKLIIPSENTVSQVLIREGSGVGNCKRLGYPWISDAGQKKNAVVKLSEIK
jgi:hypothetical protein